MIKEELWIRLSYISNWSAEHYLKKIKSLEKNIDKINFHNQNFLLSHEMTACHLKQFWSLPQDTLLNALNWLKKAKRKILPLHHFTYPKSIFHSTTPPKLLWCEGNINLLNEKKISIIGTRNPSLYGRYWAKHFTEELSNEGLVIISGLAIGIDSVVHQTLLDLNKPSIAIISSGLERIYPTCNHSLASAIIANGGLIISDVPPETKQTISRFASQNFLLSTLPDALLVIEAGMQSGSLMTARFAIEEGREVFTLAHPIGQSEGTQWLVKQGGNLVTQKEDIQNQFDCQLNWLHLNPLDKI